MKVTREQINRWLDQCPQGWTLDQSELYFGGKVLVRRIELADNYVLEAIARFRKGYDCYKKQIRIELTLRKWFKSSPKVWSSQGYAKRLTLDESCPRKDFKRLCNVVAQGNWTDEKLLETYKTTENDTEAFYAQNF